jgi:hypothetical protein
MHIFVVDEPHPAVFIYTAVAAFDGFAADAARQVTPLTLRGERQCDRISPF